MDMFAWLAQGAPPAGGAAPQAPAAPGTTTQAPDAPAPAGGGASLLNFMPFILIFVIFYVLLIKPQKKQQKEREMMIANLKKDDHVMTSGGIFGIVKQVKPEDADLVLLIDEKADVRVRISKSAIAGLVKSSGGEDRAAAPAPEKAKS